MANVLINEQHLKDIADAVRAKLGTTEKMLPANMARGIDLISTGSPDAEEALMFFLTRTEVVKSDDDDEYVANEDEIEKFTSFNWPKDLQIIGSHAFYYSIGLAVTSLPDSIKKIGQSAFYNCKNLALTSLPDGVTEIGNEAFYNCKNLALTSLPENMTKIGDRAFYKCKNLALTSLPENMTEIGYRAFYRCENLALTSLPENMIEIPNAMFYGCTNLALTSLPPGLTEIGEEAFEGCEKLAFTSLPENITKIGFGAFRDCTNLALTSLPPRLTEIGGYTFANCTNLALTSLPPGLTEIGENAFENCTCFKNLVISPEGPRIHQDAFQGCNFETVIINGNSSEYQYELTYGIQRTNMDTLILNGNVLNRNNNYYLVFWWLQESQIRETIINFDINEEDRDNTELRHIPSEICTFNSCANLNWSTSINECTNLTTINFKNGLKATECCIHNCNNLYTINIYLSEQNITELHDWIIQCPSVTTINIIGPSDSIKKGMIKISDSAFGDLSDITINVPWSENETPNTPWDKPSNAPWGASNATVNYNYKGN